MAASSRDKLFNSEWSSDEQQEHLYVRSCLFVLSDATQHGEQLAILLTAAEIGKTIAVGSLLPGLGKTQEKQWDTHTHTHTETEANKDTTREHVHTHARGGCVHVFCKLCILRLFWESLELCII